MKLNVTVNLVRVDTLRPSDIRALPREMQDTLSKMPQAEGLKKSILFVDSFPPKLIDNNAVPRYFPMLIERTFQGAVALLQHCDNLIMTRGPLTIFWHKGINSFVDQDGDVWCPSPADVLSDKEEWYVNSKNQPDQESPKFPHI